MAPGTSSIRALSLTILSNIKIPILNKLFSSSFKCLIHLEVAELAFFWIVVPIFLLE